MKEGSIMKKNIFRSTLVVLICGLSLAMAQDADPIEAARQAKLAAEKAAADAEAATGAAIEAAAAKAAKAAREKVIADREAEEARKIAEKEAAENAEIDAAAEAAALEARRKLAAELGLELEEVPDSSVQAEVETDLTLDGEDDTTTSKSFKFGLSSAVGLVNSKAFSSVPLGGTLVVTTPHGASVGGLDLTFSLGIGNYTGKYDEPGEAKETFNPLFFGIGANAVVANLFFSETHIGIVGKGPGIRQFAGVTLERIMKKSLNLPFNILVGGEGFISSDIQGSDVQAYWGGLGIRLDLNL